MPLQYLRDGYRFRAYGQSLTIAPGPKAITLGLSELDQTGAWAPSRTRRGRGRRCSIGA
jgi:hypothetical protein